MMKWSRQLLTMCQNFIRTFEAMAAKLAGERGVKFLVQGTLYPDVVESGGVPHGSRQWRRVPQGRGW